MLSDYPILFNSIELPEPQSWEESSKVIETVNQTEAGTDQIVITRYDKLSISCSFVCSNVWIKKFKDFSMLDDITAQFYDPITNGYKSHLMRIRDFKYSIVDKSWRTPNTNGLYDLSFTLEEF